MQTVSVIIREYCKYHNVLCDVINITIYQTQLLIHAPGVNWWMGIYNL